MEALRISIGLEAYAQRDPLVQYKSRAYELFQNLLSDMRMGVVTRMFTYQPRDFSSIQTGVARSETTQPEAVAAMASESSEAIPEGAVPEPAQESQTDGNKPAKKRSNKKERVSVSKKRRRSRR